MSTVNDIPDPVVFQRGELVWEIARLFPPQGDWTKEAYSAIESTRLVELVDGCLEFPGMPMTFGRPVQGRQLRKPVEGFSFPAHGTTCDARQMKRDTTDFTPHLPIRRVESVKVAAKYVHQ